MHKKMSWSITILSPLYCSNNLCLIASHVPDGNPNTGSHAAHTACQCRYVVEAGKQVRMGIRPCKGNIGRDGGRSL